MESKADLVLHPVRMRIIQALLGRELTTQEIARTMPDVPPASLYRHLGRLAEGGIVSVVEEHRVGGAIERTYSVTLKQAVVTPTEIRDYSRDDHMRMFMAFIAGLIDGFQRYLGQEQIDFAADRVSYGQATVYLDDAELHQLTVEYVTMMQKAMALPPRPGRRARVISSIVVPEPLTGTGSRPMPEQKGDLE